MSSLPTPEFLHLSCFLGLGNATHFHFIIVVIIPNDEILILEHNSPMFRPEQPKKYYSSSESRVSEIVGDKYLKYKMIDFSSSSGNCCKGSEEAAIRKMFYYRDD